MDLDDFFDEFLGCCKRVEYVVDSLREKYGKLVVEFGLLYVVKKDIKKR